ETRAILFEIVIPVATLSRVQAARCGQAPCRGRGMTNGLLNSLWVHTLIARPESATLPQLSKKLKLNTIPGAARPPTPGSRARSMHHAHHLHRRRPKGTGERHAAVIQTAPLRRPPFFAPARPGPPHAHL